MGYLTFEGLRSLDENITLSGCEHARRAVRIKKKGGIKIFGLQVVDPTTSYKVVCHSKAGDPCGAPCPAGILKSRLDQFHREAEKIK